MSRVEHKAAAETKEAIDANRLVSFLQSPATYPDHPSQVECIETHISWVFRTPHYVYKLKKTVQYPFLDFSKLPQREWACREELRLNRRMAANVYLDVMPITSDGKSLHLNGRGTVVDWVVRMRRLQDEQNLCNRLNAGRVSTRDIDGLAAFLAEFYRGQPPIAVQVEDYRRTLNRLVCENRDELSAGGHQLPRLTVERIHTAQLQLLHLAPELFDVRVLDGRIIDGHGDLRPEHIYLNGSPLVIDCVEFNSELRRIDVVDELAYLAMECDYLNAPALGEAVLKRYFKLSADRPPRVLVPFYKAYRASVRAKVSALRETQAMYDASAACRDTAARQHGNAEMYLDLADRYAAHIGRPLMIVVCGVSGTGKTTIAQELQEFLSCRHLQTDEIRRRIFPSPSKPAAFDAGIYQAEHRDAVYEEMFRLAEEYLRDGLSVILDGTFLVAALRTRAAAIAATHGAGLFVLRCEASRSSACRRIAQRASAGGALSDARPEFYDKQLAAWQEDTAPLPGLCVDTSDDRPFDSEAICRGLRKAAYADEDLMADDPLAVAASGRNETAMERAAP